MKARVYKSGQYWMVECDKGWGAYRHWSAAVQAAITHQSQSMTHITPIMMDIAMPEWPYPGPDAQMAMEMAMGDVVDTINHEEANGRPILRQYIKGRMGANIGFEWW